jgi:CspA family cold shock protein
VPKNTFYTDKFMITGKVKFFDMTKGFGFIAPNDGSKDVFVHISALQRSGIDKLVDNQVVNFEITEERGKQAATNLSLA